MRRRSSIFLTVAALCTTAMAALPAGTAAADPARPTEWREVFSPDGTITQVRIPKQVEPPVTRPEAQAAAATKVTALQKTGPSDSRFDMVIVGDGYTASETGLMRQHAQSKWNEIAGTAPWDKYRNSVNVWLVEVVSKESGVDNDPAPGVNRDTALDMNFNCGGMDRLLCVNTSKAMEYANQAPGVDTVIAIGNSTKYGGAGYTSVGLATVSGGNAQAGRIALHELGHSVGGLADEYYTPGTTYTGAEPSEPNVTTDPRGSKWAKYLGKSTPDGGVIGVHEGAHQFERGVYRPSRDSLMSNINKPFNLIGLDVMDRAISAKTGGSTGPVPGPGPVCTDHRTSRTGSLTTGGTAYEPGGASFHAGAGTHRACLAGPGGSTFRLQLLHWSGSAWHTVATSGSDGTLTHRGAEGHYLYQVSSASGAGSYTLGYTAP
ncbi:M64 family metallopeptidase [Streptomyces sp. AC627_RSS907]|uniref:M64 family metallopeptidase n=1 Tax=Streptomyces sp. AC627_RSS907 TaxID=2823684 RepID=UPI001C22F93F|nr:M64 family metallopeptidase [Streptomyces sp. AC627_RSS907]